MKSVSDPRPGNVYSAAILWISVKILKLLRLPIEKAVGHLCLLEQLLFTMSTIDHPSGGSLSDMPPPTFVFKRDDPGLLWPVTAAQGRESKRRAIRGFMTADEALGK